MCSFRVRAGFFAALLTGGLAAPAMGYVTFNGHAYEELTNPAGSSWDNAEATALSLGGHLAKIETAAEDAFIISAFDVFNYNNPANGHFDQTPDFVFGPWIGLHRNLVGTFSWDDGSPITYNGFMPGEPNEGGGVQYLYNGFDFTPPQQGWNDQQNIGPGLTLVKSFIVEFDTPTPAPGAASLLVLGCGLMGRRRR